MRRWRVIQCYEKCLELYLKISCWRVTSNVCKSNQLNEQLRNQTKPLVTLCSFIPPWRVIFWPQNVKRSFLFTDLSLVKSRQIFFSRYWVSNVSAVTHGRKNSQNILPLATLLAHYWNRHWPHAETAPLSHWHHVVIVTSSPSSLHWITYTRR